MNENAALRRAGRKLPLGVIVELPAGDNVDFHSSTCEVEHEIAKQLAGRRMVRKKVSVKNNETFHKDAHAIAFSVPKPNLLSTCIRVCWLPGRKQFVDLSGQVI